MDTFLGRINRGLVSRRLLTSELSPQSCLATPRILFKTRRPSDERPKGTHVKPGLFGDEWQTPNSKFVPPGGGGMGLMLTGGYSVLAAWRSDPNLARNMGVGGATARQDPWEWKWRGVLGPAAGQFQRLVHQPTGPTGHAGSCHLSLTSSMPFSTSLSQHLRTYIFKC